MVFRNVQELPKHVADHHDIPVPNSSQLKFSTGQHAARFFFQTHRLNFQNQLYECMNVCMNVCMLYLCVRM